eukprot:234301_1
MESLQSRLSNVGFVIDTETFPHTQFRYPMVGIILYLITTIYFQPPPPSKSAAPAPKSKSKKKVKKPITTLKLCICVHNILLCVFSGLTFYNTFPIISSIFLKEGFNGALCGKK